MGRMLSVTLSTFVTEAFPVYIKLQNKLDDRERASPWPDDKVTHFVQQLENMKQRGHSPSLILSLPLAPVDMCCGPMSDL